ncbi:hypothetical protein [Kistimonas asteriae]|uniref:hypothetical protein n=1 Tax=Kistimonas asteriae TaxID=517724 RepID=UPI001BA855F9|nr:hypothetical protein [Kistimonas asteriae]
MKKQHGMITTELAIGVLVVSLLFGLYTVITRGENLDKIAEHSGKMAGQVNNAIRAYIAERGSSAPASATYTSLGWLKDAATCSGATGTMAFLPCDFPETLDLGLTYRITVTNTAGRILSTMTLGIPNDSTENLPYLSGQVVTGAKGSDVLSLAPGVSNTYYTVADDANGNVRLTASNDPATDMYLRKDGTVLPTADFDWNNHRIDNISDLAVNNTISAGSDITSGRNVTATGYMSGSSFIDRDDSNYYVDPSADSRVENLDANMIVLRGDFVEGTACTTEAVGTTSDGRLMSCVAGLWKRHDGGTPVVTGYKNCFWKEGQGGIWGPKICPSPYVQVGHNYNGVGSGYAYHNAYCCELTMELR